MGEWRPWRELRERPGVELVVTRLPAGAKAIIARRGEDVAIIINSDLPRAERWLALTHELIHLERGGGCHQPGLPELLQVGVLRDERQVQAEAIRRTLPPTEDLHAYASAIADMGDVVEPWQLAEDFDITEEQARAAIRLLGDDSRVA